MAFVVNQRVWFKASGSTPFIVGDPTNPALEVGKEIAGRGQAAIGFVPSQNGLGNVQGVPQILATDGTLPPALDSNDAEIGTFSGGPQGVVEDDNNLIVAGHVVTVSGIFGPPTDVALFNVGSVSGILVDEGATDRNRINTIRTQDPNVAAGRSASSGAAVAEGPAVVISGNLEFANEIIDLKTAANREGIRTPSSQQGAGVVISVVTGVSPTNKSPDGTLVGSTRMYWVNWGVPNPSDPHRAKWARKARVLLHAEEDLVAA
jgi:hypothetical protein